MDVGKLIKITFYLFITLLGFKAARVACNKLFIDEIEDIDRFKLNSEDIKIPKREYQSDRKKGYDFQRMLNLVETCEKVRYLDYLHFSGSANNVVRVNPDTIQELIKSLNEERTKLRRYIWKFKSGSQDSIPSKRMKALKYYLRVIELNLQDMKVILLNKR